MQIMTLTRRAAILGASASLGGCSAVSSINAAATPLDTYDLSPAPGSSAGGGTGGTLLVAAPNAPAPIKSDRIMVKPGVAAVTYLPDARWSDEVPALVQSLLVRSIAATGRMGYVGPNEAGPVPDLALLSRIDVFQVEVIGAALIAKIDISLTLLRDSDQSVIKTASFRNEIAAVNDTPAAIVAAFQAILDTLLPQMATWAATG
ncbi:ABC-type transport auxiliary lipoprotein family protein [Salipiger thiooxidans]|uniref:ABC-type transport auxiliary lipoprotein family protein n=1 Tax=Salipiger thiooxidans TaxID=282683 RepID=UPI001CD5C65C|nr:ABC-type transport auxiliary lipoprotein family protein [Salipiger thiooxidans]MCA0851004.1 ABC-type transport auxiliary lipoprotein family protein [Salipiger thiooxidans]